MPARSSPSQKAIVARVMSGFKDGDLDKSDGEPVTDRKQAIALHEAGASDRESSETNRRNLRRTEARGKAGNTPAGAPPTRAVLYAEAKRREIAGRSSMTKAELAGALGDRR